MKFIGTICLKEKFLAVPPTNPVVKNWSWEKRWVFKIAIFHFHDCWQRVSSSSVCCSFQNSITDLPQLSKSQLFSLSPLQRRWLRYVSYAMCQAPNVEPFQSARTALSRPFWSARFHWKVPQNPPMRLRGIPQLEEQSWKTQFVPFRTSKRWRLKHPNHHLPSNSEKPCVGCYHLRLTKHTSQTAKMAAKQTLSLTPKTNSPDFGGSRGKGPGQQNNVANTLEKDIQNFWNWKRLENKL